MVRISQLSFAVILVMGFCEMVLTGKDTTTTPTFGQGPAINQHHPSNDPYPIRVSTYNGQRPDRVMKMSIDPNGSKQRSVQFKVIVKSAHDGLRYINGDQVRVDLSEDRTVLNIPHLGDGGVSVRMDHFGERQLEDQWNAHIRIRQDKPVMGTHSVRPHPENIRNFGVQDRTQTDGQVRHRVKPHQRPTTVNMGTVNAPTTSPSYTHGFPGTSDAGPSSGISYGARMAYSDGSEESIPAQVIMSNDIDQIHAMHLDLNEDDDTPTAFIILEAKRESRLSKVLNYIKSIPERAKARLTNTGKDTARTVLERPIILAASVSDRASGLMKKGADKSRERGMYYLDRGAEKLQGASEWFNGKAEAVSARIGPNRQALPKNSAKQSYHIRIVSDIARNHNK